MMVFSGILKSTNQNTSHPSATATLDSTSQQTATASDDKSKSTSPTASATAASLIADPAGSPYLRTKENLLPLDAEIPDLRELNHSLEALAAIFPDVQVEVFREMLSSFEEESRLAVVTEALLKHNIGSRRRRRKKRGLLALKMRTSYGTRKGLYPWKRNLDLKDTRRL